MNIDELSGKVIGCAIEVHSALGPGLLESTYKKCLVYELQHAGMKVNEEYSLPVKYKGMSLENAFRIDVLVNDRLVVELKAVDKIAPVHIAQMLS